MMAEKEEEEGGEEGVLSGKVFGWTSRNGRLSIYRESLERS